VTDRLIWITLLVKLGVVASVASVLARVVTFRRLFFAERRTGRQTLALLAFFLVPLTLGVWVRFWVPNFLAADISFETVILLGLLLGPAGPCWAAWCCPAPAVYHHEYLALPFNVALGLARAAGPLCRAGRDLVVHAVHRPEPLPLGAAQSAPAAHRPPVPDAVSDRGMEAAATGSPTSFRTGCLRCSRPVVAAGLVWLSAPIDVGIALKVWNTLRMEMKLEEQKRLLLEARLDACSARSIRTFCSTRSTPSPRWCA
jgi:two-component system LytT family sensor kinase